MELTILGSGTSHGIPVPGCSCRVCVSSDPRDQRYRASVLLRAASGATIVIDTGPEFRLQAIRAGIKRLDCVLVTHAHADHIHGLDDLRALTGAQAMPIYASPETILEIRSRFSYIFASGQTGGGKPYIHLEPVRGPFRAAGLDIVPIPLLHGSLPILGYRIGALAYLTDASFVPEKSFSLLEGVTCIVIGGLRFRPHPTHFTVEEACSTARRIAARGEARRGHVLITHICDEVSHVEAEEACRAFQARAGMDGWEIGPAWDGLSVSMPE
jgi:phosphoribosyl 1,2-cyclic phosphate phosphodiesterase